MKAMKYIIGILAITYLLIGCGDGDKGSVSKSEGKKLAESERVSIVSQNPVGNPPYPADRAFDNSTSPASFWESIGYPVSVVVTYGSQHPISSYQLLTGEVPTRMPQAWKLEGSTDGKDWSELDSQSDGKNWAVDEVRTYTLKNQSSYRMYRFSFTKGFDPNGIFRIYEIKL